MPERIFLNLSKLTIVSEIYLLNESKWNNKFGIQNFILKGILSQLILKFQIIKLNILLSEPRFPRHEIVSVIIDILARCQFQQNPLICV